MVEKLKSIPLYVILVPVSFVLHGYIQHFGFIQATDAAWLALIYCAFSECVFLLSWYIFKKSKKAALMSVAWIGIYLYFGALHDFLRTYSPFPFLYRYRIMMPMILVSLVILFIYLKKTENKFTRTTLFLNILFLIYISIDTVDALWKSTRKMEKTLFMNEVYPGGMSLIPDSCLKPDIYLLLFDEYASTLSLKERYNFHNDIDSFFESSGFSVQKESTSNYNYTPFSIASTLNMTYLNWPKPERGVNRDDFLKCNPAILNNTMIKFLVHNGYDIVNLSVFDLAGYPSKLRQSFLPVKTKMIAEGTMFPRLYKDFESVFIGSELLSALMGEDYFFQHISNNNLLFSDVVKESERMHVKPRFIYAHFYLPHEPFFFDEHGKRKNNKTLVQEEINPSATAYLKYVLYTNTRIKPFIQTIMKNTGRKASIIALSDHGFRFYKPVGVPLWHFQNLNAVYFPNRNYHLLYDSISNVNEFRVVLNSLFDQQLPLLRDSTIYLFDHKYMHTPPLEK